MSGSYICISVGPRDSQGSLTAQLHRNRAQLERSDSCYFSACLGGLCARRFGATARGRSSLAPTVKLGLGAVISLGYGTAGAADIAHGKQIANLWCAACHIVAPDQKRGADTHSPTERAALQTADIARRVIGAASSINAPRRRDAGQQPR